MIILKLVLSANSLTENVSWHYEFKKFVPEIVVFLEGKHGYSYHGNYELSEEFIEEYDIPQDIGTLSLTLNSKSRSITMKLSMGDEEIIDKFKDFVAESWNIESEEKELLKRSRKTMCSAYN